MQVSLATESAGKVPAGITPTHIKPTGESAVALFKSQLLTAYPSMAELSKPGNDTFALASEAAKRPSASLREMVSPPSEKKIVALANTLNEDPDVLLAMAGKVSTELKGIIMKRPKLFAEVLRKLKTEPDNAILNIVREVKDGDW